MQIYNAKYLDIVMLMHNLIEFSDNYSKATGIYLQFCRDEPNDTIRGANNKFNNNKHQVLDAEKKETQHYFLLEN